MIDNTVWVPESEQLRGMSAPELWELLDGLSRYKQAQGRGKSEAALHVKDYCKAEAARVRKALRHNGFPIKPPERPWSAWWPQPKGTNK